MNLNQLLLIDVTSTDVGCTTALNTQKSVAACGGEALAKETAKRKVYDNLVGPNSQGFHAPGF